MVVVIKLCLLPLVVVGIAIRTVAWGALAAPEIVFRIPLNVIGDDQIEVSVLVVVKPTGAGRPFAFIGNTGFGCDVGESPIAVVVIENGAAIAGHVKVGIAVFVDVSHRDTLAIMSFASDTGFIGDVRKSS